jgi:hypothetical protein
MGCYFLKFVFSKEDYIRCRDLCEAWRFRLTLVGVMLNDVVMLLFTRDLARSNWTFDALSRCETFWMGDCVGCYDGAICWE